VVIDFWSNQYYHPDYETTYHAKPRYDIIKNAFKYAHDIGLRTGVVLFPCMVPASVYYDNPSMRARNAEGPWGYKGCHLCWNKGKELAVKFDRYLLEHFNGEVDTLFIEPNDPGICGCKECMKNYVQIVKEIIEVYEKLARKYTADRWIGFISWWFSEVERAVGGNICREVFSSLPKGTLVVDGVRSTLNIAKECGHEIAFFFMLDPERGWEDRALITRPELRLIDAQIKKSLEAGDVGIMNYRLTPFCQFIADYVFGRKCWDASLFDKNIITELSAEICRTNEGREKFTEAVLALEKWWMDKDVRDLRRANKLFNELKYVEKEGMIEKIEILADVTVVFTLIAEYWAKGALIKPGKVYEKVTDELLEKVYASMIDKPIFEGYIGKEAWVNRQRALLSLKVPMWMTAIDQLNTRDKIRRWVQ